MRNTSSPGPEPSVGTDGTGPHRKTDGGETEANNKGVDIRGTTREVLCTT